MGFEQLRRKMVEQQLIARGISDQRVLAAFQKVARHKFVPEKYHDRAYGDYPLPIGLEQTISQPYMVALMTQSLGLKPEATVLEIGTGSGYQAAILAELAVRVFSVERVPELAEQASRRLADLDYQNIQIKIADGTCGWPEFAPYDGILVAAGAPAVPQPLIDQLKMEKTLVIPLGNNFTQTLTAIKKRPDKTETRQLCGCIFVPLKGVYGWSEKDG